MVEAIANGIDDKLVDSLSFKAPPGASCVTDRRSVTYHPLGGNSCKPGSGAKVIPILLAGDQWLDPSTFRIMLDVRNNDETGSKKLRRMGSPRALFRRTRILAGGQVVEDISEYSRLREMVHTLTANESRINDYGEGFGPTWTDLRTHNTAVELPGIEPNQSQTVFI